MSSLDQLEEVLASAHRRERLCVTFETVKHEVQAWLHWRSEDEGSTDGLSRQGSSKTDGSDRLAAGKPNYNREAYWMPDLRF